MLAIDEFCRQYNISLSDQQKKAAEAVEGQVLLLAVPGSGKTTVLVSRLGYMILGREIAPENILTITYTVAATADMKERYASIFGTDAGEALEFRTINGICARIILQYGRMIGKEPFSLVTDDGQLAGILSGIYQRVEKAYPTESDLKSVRTLITYIKNSMLGEAAIRKLNDTSGYRISELYRQYNQALRENKWMDYDDQMVYALAILRNSTQMQEIFHNRYRYICVDEAQDASVIQHMIIRLLAGENGNLFMVGDEDQSIYGFRAARPQKLLDFEKDFPQAKVLLMEDNFRSGADIVKAADRFIRLNAFRHPKQMKAKSKTEAVITRVELGSRGNQYPYLAGEAREVEGTAAVLYRDNESVLPLVDLLDRQGQPYYIRSADLAFFSHRIINDIRDIVAFSADQKDTELFLRIYYKIGTYLSKENAAKACAESRKNGVTVLTAAVRYCDLPAGSERSCRDIIAAFRYLEHDKALGGLNRIIDEMGYAEYLHRAGISDTKLGILRALARRVETLSELMQRLDELQNLIRSQTRERVKGSLILSTIHASKGLEYDTVYLLDVEDGIFPETIPSAGEATQEDREKYEEERRLFYVGATRARKKLYLLDTGMVSTFRRELLAGQKVKRIRPFMEGAQGSAARTTASQMEYTSSRKLTQESRDIFHGKAYSAEHTTEKNRMDERDFRDVRSALSKGMKVEHKTLGCGKIKAVDEEHITIAFATGDRNFYLRFLLEHDLLTLVKE